MSTPTEQRHHRVASNMFPLRFKIHGFAAYCYNTLACSVIYSDHDFTRLDVQPAGPPPSPAYKEHWNQAAFSGIANFPFPATVRWASLDGVLHEEKIDIGAIFKDERVLYRVPDSEIPDRSWGDDPSIFLEVNDRTISIYMQAFIATKTAQVVGNKNSNFREDTILAWSHTY